MKKKKLKGKYLAAIFVLAVTTTFTGCTDLLKNGTELLEEKKYTEAAESFKESIKKEKNLGEAYRGLGICYWEQKKYKKAGEAFEAALENGAEKTAPLYNFLGICELKEGSPKKAVFYFQLGLDIKGSDKSLTREMEFNEIAAYEADKDFLLAKERLLDYTKKYPDDEKAKKELEFLSTQMPEKEE